MKRILMPLILFTILLGACRSRGPRNAVWESKHHPSDEYKKANEKGTKDYKNSKKRFNRLHRKGSWF